MPSSGIATLPITGLPHCAKIRSHHSHSQNITVTAHQSNTSITTRKCHHSPDRTTTPLPPQRTCCTIFENKYFFAGVRTLCTFGFCNTKICYLIFFLGGFPVLPAPLASIGRPHVETRTMTSKTRTTSVKCAQRQQNVHNVSKMCTASAKCAQRQQNAHNVCKTFPPLVNTPSEGTR